MSEDMLVFDSNINICYTVEYYEKLSLAEYNMRLAAQYMSAEEMDKAVKYVKKLTKNRIHLRSDKPQKLKRVKFNAKEIF
ncbi:MAG: hypothetical protein IJ677_08675 [Alphaproteobacteria bacterium]|nr:hypothetical protein [Alphaproteobacteria bacterium]